MNESLMFDRFFLFGWYHKAEMAFNHFHTEKYKVMTFLYKLCKITNNSIKTYEPSF